MKSHPHCSVGNTQTEKEICNLTSKRGKLSAGDMEDIGYLDRDCVYVPR